VIYETRPPSGVNEAIEEVLAGKARHAWSCTPSRSARPAGRSFRRAGRSRTIMAWSAATCRY